MTNKIRCFDNDSRGSMLVELLLSVALVAIALPFVFQYQHRAIRRSENILVTRQMDSVQLALERYIIDNRTKLSTSVGRDIIRVDIDDLLEYGLDINIVENRGDKYQLRILKTPGANSQNMLQGVVVLTDGDITPLRTREIMELSDNRRGVVEGTSTYGAFGTWRATPADIGVDASSGIVGSTSVNRDNSLYLWRVPSDNTSDATMLSALSLGGHNLVNMSFFDMNNTTVQEISKFGTISASTAIFQNRTTIDGEFATVGATVSGMMSSDGNAMEVTNTFRFANSGKFSNFTVSDLWVSNLNLSGLSVYDTSSASVLKVSNVLDMMGGRIDAMSVTVGFAGSITPRLIVSSTIYDSTNPKFYWDADSGIANFQDVAFTELNTLATYAVSGGNDGTLSYQIFSSVVANKNATASDFMNAITEIQKKVRAKYRRLNLE